MTNFLLNKGLSGRSLMRTSAEGRSVDHSKLYIALLLGFQFYIWETESVRHYISNLCGLVFFAATLVVIPGNMGSKSLSSKKLCLLEICSYFM